MTKKIQLLDCTLRDGAYINGSLFGKNTIKGIIKRLSDAKVDIIECGWLKDQEHDNLDSSYFHVPQDVIPYLEKKDPNVTYVAMVDFDRYNVDNLPENDGSSIDAIRVVFPRGKAREGLDLAIKIREKGYRIFCQAANTLGYSDEELLDLIKLVNEVEPEAISIVDTFGAMYPEDLDRILSIFSHNLKDNITIGFHGHNNQQLSFALCMQFVRYLTEQNRTMIVDSSLCGMGRGAGNATTELVTSFLNKKHYGNYDLDLIMSTIDMYMVPFLENFKWGYSIPTYIAGMYCSHVNNIDYLLKKHRANVKEIRSVISSLTPADRVKYDYDLLESKYIENQNHEIDDEKALNQLKANFANRNILLIAPGKSSVTQSDIISDYAKANDCIVIAVNALIEGYDIDYLFLQSRVRYEYARETHPQLFSKIPKILLSNVREKARDNEYIIRYERAIKRGWVNFDNAMICVLRLLDKLHVQNIAIAGFDTFSSKYNASYADEMIPSVHGVENWDAMNKEIKEIYKDFRKRTQDTIKVTFVTKTDFISEYDRFVD
ncbi:MAG: aldolase catalytic domain-containing protein [Succinivibrio sp.]|nr:aldolase catalytic domain-containing protein [Succinivibrio sp.]